MAADKRSDAGRDRTDWERLRSLSETEIERIADADPDNPATVSDAEWTDAFVGLPAIRTPNGDRPPQRTLRARFDSDVVAFFERGGRGYQQRMNAVLRLYMETRLREEAER